MSTDVVPAKRPKPPPKGRHIDWTMPKAAYVYGMNQEDGGLRFPSMREIAEAFGIAEQSVFKRAVDDRWEAARAAAREEIVRRVGETRMNAVVERAAALDERAGKVFEAVLAIVGNKLAEAHKAKRDIPPKELAELTRAAEIAHRGGRLSLGEATERVDLPRAAFVVTGGRARVIDAEQVDDDAA